MIYTNERHFVESEVKINSMTNEKLESKKDRNNTGIDSSHDKYSERRSEKRRNESPFDLKDIPLPNTNDSNKVIIFCFIFSKNHFYFIFVKLIKF